MQDASAQLYFLVDKKSRVVTTMRVASLQAVATRSLAGRARFVLWKETVGTFNNRVINRAEV